MKRVIRTGVIVLLTTLALLWVKNEYARLLPVSAYGMQAAIRKKKIDNLFIGLSMFRQGLSIDVLEEELPSVSYILSYNGNQPVFMAMELQYMLEEGLEVENLYIDLYPYMAAATPWISDTKILLDTDLDFKMETWKLLSADGEATPLDFYEMFVTANNEQLLTWPVNNRLISSQFRNGGTLLVSSGQTAEYLDSLELLGSRDGLNDVQIDGYREIMELADAYGMNLYFLETPKYVRMYEDADYRELYEACVGAVRDLAAQTETEVKWIFAEDLDFDNTDPSCYQDLIHLSTEGRTVYTRRLCEAVAANQD